MKQIIVKVDDALHKNIRRYCLEADTTMAELLRGYMQEMSAGSNIEHVRLAVKNEK